MKSKLRVVVRLLLVIVAAVLSMAQNAGNVGTQTMFQIALNAVTVPTASSPFRNIGQSAHWLTYCTTGSTVTLSIQLEASNDAVTWFPISHVGTTAFVGVGGCSVLQAGGYFQNVRVNLTTITGVGGQVVTAFYTGSTGPIAGNFISDAIQVQGQELPNPFGVGTVYGSLQVAVANNQSFAQTAVSAVNTAVGILGASITNLKISQALYHVSAFCSAGTSTLNICTGTTLPCTVPNTVFSLPVGTTPLILPFASPMVAPGGTSALTTELLTCGAGNVGRINIVSGYLQAIR